MAAGDPGRFYLSGTSMSTISRPNPNVSETVPMTTAARLRDPAWAALLVRLALCIGLLLGAGAALAQQGLASYRLGSGDVIAISVYGEEDLSIEERIHDDGIIAYPFLGELKVGGRRVVEVEQLITRGLSNGYLVDPRVRVSIREYRPFFIHGEVKDPGGYPYQPSLTVRKAVSLAGGLTERASESKITVIREGKSTAQPLTMDAAVGPGDIINVPQSFF